MRHRLIIQFHSTSVAPDHPLQNLSSSNPSPGDAGQRLSRRRFLRLLGASAPLATVGTCVEASPAAESPLAREVIEQKPGLGACGPCAIANSLLHGDPATRRAFQALPGASSAARADALIARYGTRPSETYGPGRGRFLAGAGIATGDVPFLANDFLAAAGLPAVVGQFLDRLPAERDDERAHLRRVHALFRAALARGLPPVLELRAFTSNPGNSKEPWNNYYAHWLTLLSLEPSELALGASGFSCRFADSFTGRIVPGFAYAERFRPFMATRGFTVLPNGNKEWHWLDGHPYILLQIPDVPMNLEACPAHERALVALTYMVARPAA